MSQFAETRTAPLPSPNSQVEWQPWMYWLGHAVPMGYDSFTDEECAEWSSKATPNSALFRDAVASYQGYHVGLNTQTGSADGSLRKDGDLGRLTMQSANNRICTHRDIGPIQFGTVQWASSPQFPIVFEWRGPDYELATASSYDITRRMYEIVCGMDTAPSRSRGDGDIYGGAERLDGNSNVLADSFSPDRQMRTRAAGGRRSLRQRYDHESLWRDLGNILTVMFHELEHATWADGHLSASQYPGNIINPSFTGSRVQLVNGVWVPRLGAKEREFLIRHYGPPKGVTPLPPGGESEIVTYLTGRYKDETELLPLARTLDELVAGLVARRR